VKNILELRNISKNFPGVKALDHVSFSIAEGEIHCIAGQNGAGKSTLIKILAGAYQADEGEIIYKGQRAIIPDPHTGLQMGISVIYQELDLIPYLTAAENIWVGRYPKIAGSLIDWRRIDKDSGELLDSLGCQFDRSLPLEQLGPGAQQMIAIAKSVSHKASVLIMDEPTSSLSDNELVHLFQTIAELKRKGTTIIYITHKLNEIFELGDRVTVLRDGCCTGTWETNKVDQDFLVEQMIGHHIEKRTTTNASQEGEALLTVSHISTKKSLRDVSFELRKGEVLGFAGLVGSGRTELMRILFAADKLEDGDIRLGEKAIRPRNPVEAKRLGLALVPENRKTEGLVLSLSVLENLILPSLEKFQVAGIIQREPSRRRAREESARLNTKVTSLRTEVNTLSGGNQQKVVLAKWLLAGAKIMLLDEPTRGIDIGAREEIYHIVRELVASGIGIIMVSSEFPELLNACDRILVMNSGQIVGEFNAKTTTKEELMECAILGNGKKKMLSEAS
jgi:ribose transport system ATP-binding protein